MELPWFNRNSDKERQLQRLDLLDGTTVAQYMYKLAIKKDGVAG
jgi:hypothetical protein